MAGFSGIEPIAGANQAPLRDERGAAGSLVFGAAVTHREAARANQRVSPGAVADRKRAGGRVRSDDEAKDGKGRLVDISV